MRLMSLAQLRQGAFFREIFSQQNPQLSEGELDRIVGTFATNPTAKSSTLRQFREATKPDFFDGFDEMNKKICSEVPVEVVWGTEDPYIPNKYAHYFASANVEIPEGKGHWPPIVSPDAVASAVRKVQQ